ncbi:hypothetical protein LCGC14_1584920 [marine sediment metagenome]|uniref:Uncharacterized protein n=1 Tax=marine sediment metagenome TaxID=412755 RepID=A0A0F9J1V7_9ZZZZ
MAEETAVTEIPSFRDEENVIVHLNRKDFPKGKDGSLSHCDYMIEVWNEKKGKVEAKYDPKKKARARVDKLRAKLAELEAELEADE